MRANRILLTVALMLGGAHVAAAQECRYEPSPLDAIGVAVHAGLADPCGGAFGAKPDAAAKQIAALGGPKADVTTIPLWFQPSASNQAAMPLPLYRVVSANGSVHYVDANGRGYDSFEDWKAHNTLPDGKVTYPKGGTIDGPSCNSTPETSSTPSSSGWNKAKGWGDKIAMVGGIGLGVAAIIGTGGLAIPIAGAVLAGWGAYRSIDGLHDLGSHHESLNPITSANARSQWIGLASSGVGLAAMGSSLRAAAILAREGSTVTGVGAATLASRLAVASTVVNTVSLGDGTVNLAVNWKDMTKEQRILQASQLAFSIGMFGYQAHQAGGIANLYDAGAIRSQMIRSYARSGTAITDDMMKNLQDAFGKLGMDSSPDQIRRWFSMQDGVPDAAVNALLKKVLADPAYAPQVKDVLSRYGADTLAKGVETPEGKVLRLEMLMLAVPDETRPALMEAVRTDIGAGSDRIKTYLTTSGQGVDANGQPIAAVKRVIIGGGPQGGTLANELNRIGQGDGTLLVDASRAGDNNFGDVRNFRLNSETGRYEGRVGGHQEGRTANPLHGAPLQVDDLEPPTPGNPYPNAGTFGDTAVLALDAARHGGTDVLTETRVTNVVAAGAGKPGRYLVTMQDSKGTYQVFTNQIIDATGLGAPSIPLKDPATISYVNAQTTAIKTNGGSALPHQSVVHGEDLLRTYTNATPEQRLAFLQNSKGNLVIVGGGDAAKTAAELLMKIAADNHTTVGQVLGDRKIEWVGIKQSDVWSRYSDLNQLFDQKIVVPVDGARLQSIAPVPGTDQARLTFTLPDGSTMTKDYGRAILTMGMKASAPDFLKNIDPAYNPKTDRVPVLGNDPVYGDASPLGSQLKVGNDLQDIFFAGVSSGQDRPAGTSFLEYFGWKNLLLADQKLGGAPGPASPFHH